ncbi:MAG: phage major capsid protein [Ktedonobacteraceae bacterium]
MEPREIRQKMNEIWSRMKEIDQGAVTENRQMSAEERNNWNSANKELEILEDQLTRSERMRSLNGKLTTPAGGAIITPNGVPAEARKSDPNDPIPEIDPEDYEARIALRTKNDLERRPSFKKYLRYGYNHMTEKEARNLQKDINTAGGYLMAPIQFVTDLIKTVDNMVYIRQMSTTFQLENAQNLSFPVRTSRMSSGEWTPEVEDGVNPADDTGLQFGLRVFQPNKLTKRIKASNVLLRMSPMGPEQIIIDEFKYLFATTMEQAYLTGNGAKQPLGMFVASQQGMYTDRDVVMPGTVAAPNWFDGLIELQGNLKQQYQPNAQFLLHRTTLTQIKLQKSTTNFYIWQPPQAGAPPTILGKEYTSSEYVPNTLSANDYVVMYADFKNMYRIVDSLDMELIRLDELYQAQDQTGFICRMWSDGSVVLSEAGSRLQMPAS